MTGDRFPLRLPTIVAVLIVTATLYIVFMSTVVFLASLTDEATGARTKPPTGARCSGLATVNHRRSQSVCFPPRRACSAAILPTLLRPRPSRAALADTAFVTVSGMYSSRVGRQRPWPGVLHIDRYSEAQEGASQADLAAVEAVETVGTGDPAQTSLSEEGDAEVLLTSRPGAQCP